MMMIYLSPDFEDARGQITDILTKQSGINHITLIKSAKGAVRGNHYHKLSSQFIYVMDGKMRVKTLDRDTVAIAGALICHVPGEPHAYEYLEDTTMLAMVEGVRGGDDYEQDTYKLETPLL